MLEASLVQNKGLCVNRLAVLERHSTIHTFFVRANTGYGCASSFTSDYGCTSYSKDKPKSQSSFWNV